jgi:hypothetical protein
MRGTSGVKLTAQERMAGIVNQSFAQLGPPRAESRVVGLGEPESAATVATTGRLRAAYARARSDGDRQAIASVWLGTAALVCSLLAFVSHSSALYDTGLLAGIPAIVTARFARQRGRELGDKELVYLSRYGQIFGWIVVGIFLLAVVFIAVVLGAFLGSLPR